MSTDTSNLVHTDPRAAILEALTQCDEPITADKLRKQLAGVIKRTKKQFGDDLESLAGEGVVHRFAPAPRTKAERYWHQDASALEAHERRRALAKAKDVALAVISKAKSGVGRVQLAKRKELKALGAEQIGGILDELVANKSVYLWPPKGASKEFKYRAERPNPCDHLGTQLNSLARKTREVAGVFEKSGLSERETFEAVVERLRDLLGLEPNREREPEPIEYVAPPEPAAPITSAPDLENLLCERMGDVEPAYRSGALVSLKELRRSVASNAKKGDFDAAVMRLAETGKVALHRHNDPLMLDESERAEYVADDRGGYYMGISLRV